MLFGCIVEEDDVLAHDGNLFAQVGQIVSRTSRPSMRTEPDMTS